jgi:hypothetical protein
MCDHITGVTNKYLGYGCAFELMSKNYSKYNDHLTEGSIYECKFCPECGEKLEVKDDAD